MYYVIFMSFHFTAYCLMDVGYLSLGMRATYLLPTAYCLLPMVEGGGSPADGPGAGGGSKFGWAVECIAGC